MTEDSPEQERLVLSQLKARLAEVDRQKEGWIRSSIETADMHREDVAELRRHLNAAYSVIRHMKHGYTPWPQSHLMEWAGLRGSEPMTPDEAAAINAAMGSGT